MDFVMDISFLLPTNRPPQYANNFLNKLTTIDSKNYTYETVVCSPYNNVNWGPNTQFLLDNQSDGPIAAFNAMISVAKGEYLVCVIDDHIPVDNGKFFDFIPWLNSDFYQDRRFKITSFYTNHLPQRIPILGETWCGDIKEEHNNRKHITVRFPIIDRKTIQDELQNHIFHPTFKYHASDLWLGFFMGEEEFSCIECPSQLEQYIGLCNQKNRNIDCQTYHRLKLKYLNGYKKYV